VFWFDNTKHKGSSRWKVKRRPRAVPPNLARLVRSHELVLLLAAFIKYLFFSGGRRGGPERAV
jgi:hypothetical protein